MISWSPLSFSAAAVVTTGNEDFRDLYHRSPLGNPRMALPMGYIIPFAERFSAFQGGRKPRFLPLFPLTNEG